MMDENVSMMEPKIKPSPHGHNPLSEADSPQNWPMTKKIHASLSSFLFAFTVAYGLTAYIPTMTPVSAQFNLGPIISILPFSLYLFGIAFAPIYTPHLSERFGRTPVYFASTSIFATFVLGWGLSMNFPALCITRFLAGFAGGPCLVLIEGTFADVFSEEATGVYYAVLSLAAYTGTGFGPIVGSFAVTANSWRWGAWTTLMFTVASLLLGFGMPETYARQIARDIAKKKHRKHRLPPAQSGVTLSEMANITILEPLKMLVKEPIVILSSLYLGLNFAVVFQFFITVPAVLGGVYNFPPRRVGIAFFAAIGGALLAAITGYLCDKLVFCPRHRRGTAHLEWRLLPALFGGFGLWSSLFWIGYTARPDVTPLSPILGTVLYVWGNMCVLIGIIPYLFYAYPPAGTLSALTAAASLRIALAGFLPLVILKMFMNLTGQTALTIFAAISLVFSTFPFIIFFFGAKFRMNSPYNKNTIPMDLLPSSERRNSDLSMADVESEGAMRTHKRNISGGSTHMEMREGMTSVDLQGDHAESARMMGMEASQNDHMAKIPRRVPVPSGHGRQVSNGAIMPSDPY